MERTVSSCLISGMLRNLDALVWISLGCYAGDDVAAMTELPYLVSRLVATLSSPVGNLGDVLLADEVSGLAMASLEACRGVVPFGCVAMEVALRDAGVLEGVVVAPLEAIFYSFECYFYILNY